MALRPIQFIEEVRREARRVVWPTRKETLITTLMVFIMVTVLAFFFLGVDAVLSTVVRTLLRQGV